MHTKPKHTQMEFLYNIYNFLYSFLKQAPWKHVLGASQVVLGVKKPPANAGDVRDAS